MSGRSARAPLDGTLRGNAAYLSASSGTLDHPDAFDPVTQTFPERLAKSNLIGATRRAVGSSNAPAAETDTRTPWEIDRDKEQARVDAIKAQESAASRALGRRAPTSRGTASAVSATAGTGAPMARGGASSALFGENERRRRRPGEIR